MQYSNSAVHQNPQHAQYDIYAVSQQRRQAFDIENPPRGQSGAASQQPVQVVVARQTALIYVRERPVNPPAQVVVVQQPAPAPAPSPIRQTLPVSSNDGAARQIKIVAGILTGCFIVGAGLGGLKSLYG